MQSLMVQVRAHPGEPPKSMATHTLSNDTPTVLGRGRRCDIRLSADGIARRHAELRQTADGLFLRSLTSRHALQLNAMDCRQAGPLAPGDQIQIGEVQLCITAAKAADARLSSAPPEPEPKPEPKLKPEPEPEPKLKSESELNDEPPPPTQLPAEPLSAPVSASLIRRFQALISERLDLYRRDVLQTLSADQLRNEAETAAWALISEDQIALPDTTDTQTIVSTVVAEAVGLGPIEALMQEADISEIMVNGHQRIYVERNGRIEKTAFAFSSAASLSSVLERIVSPLGRRLDEGSPLVDARLPDGSRVNAIIPPLALHGPAVTIRRFAKSQLSLEALAERDALDQAMRAFLVACIHHRRNILIAGGTGTGKTTILNALSAHIDTSERIITIEDSAELQLDQDHVVALESRPANIEGSGAIPIRDLVRNALRMRPDRILVGECRGGEALDMLQAMNTGHDGSITTAHANSPRDALARLEVMTLMAGMDLPAKAIREQISAAIDIVIQLTRFSDGRRRMTAITEVAGMEGEQLLLTELFQYRRGQASPEGMVGGYFEPSGQIPAFYESLRNEGQTPDLGIFQRANPT